MCIFRARLLRMYYTFSSCHVLNRSRSDFASVTHEVLVFKLAFKHISKGFEAAMRMRWEPIVSGNKKFVQHQKRITPTESLTSYTSYHFSTCAFCLPISFDNFHN
eukprot:NODE_152_length_16986_cov_0.478119.p15 type:complete len:105 gc:universal NODE_152_length_16986_cov_0.478119:3720-4034(+)